MGETEKDRRTSLKKKESREMIDETSKESTVNTLLVKSAASEIKERILNVKMLSPLV